MHECPNCGADCDCYPGEDAYPDLEPDCERECDFDGDDDDGFDQEC